MKTRFLLAPVLVAAVLVGCHVQAPTPPLAPLLPGAANIFDQDSYKSLRGVQASIDSLKKSIAANPTLSVLTPAVNQLITDYNYADSAWQVYHAAATSGTATPAEQTNVTAALTKAQNDSATLTKAVQ